MTDEKPYLVTFTPVGRFFFGDYQSFVDSFYVVSMKFPKPTTILGCLRHNILLQNDIPKDKNNIPDITLPEAQRLTGKLHLKSLDSDTNDDDFGIIKKLSPVFIVKQSKDENNKLEDLLFPTPVDIKTEENSCFTCFGREIKEEAISSIGTIKKNYAVCSERNIKESPPSYLGGFEFWKAYCNNISCFPYKEGYEEKRIFLKSISVGIARKDKRVKDGAYYSKTDYALEKGFSFGVVVWLTDGSKLKDNRTVLLGGEQSVFRLNIQPIDSADKDNKLQEKHPVFKAILEGETNFGKTLQNAKNSKVVVISPTLLNDDISFWNGMEHSIIPGTQIVRMAVPGDRASKTGSSLMIPEGAVLFTDSNSMNISEADMPYKIGFNNAIRVTISER